MRSVIFSLSFLLLWINFSFAANETPPPPEDEDEKSSNPREWTDFEMYDLIDTMEKYTKHQTFYSLLSVSPDSSPREISVALRKKSLEWHPDKSRHPNAQEIFSLISTAAKILQDQTHKGAKEHYDWILNEAPVWHRSAFRMKKFVTAKLSLWSVAVICFAFVHVAQFLGMWAKYLVDLALNWQARKTLSELGEKELKRIKRKIETREVPVEILENDDHFSAYLQTCRPIHKPHLEELGIFWAIGCIMRRFKKAQSSSDKKES